MSSIYVYNGIKVIKTGEQAVKKNKQNRIIHTLFEIKPINNTVEWHAWVADSELYEIITREIP